MSDLIVLAAARRNARAQQHLGWLAGGSLVLYTAPQPANADTALTTQTALGTFTLPDPAGGALGAVITIDPIADVEAVAAGTAAWGRMYDDADQVVGDYPAGALASGAAIELSSTVIETGDTLSVLGFQITEG